MRNTDKTFWVKRRRVITMVAGLSQTNEGNAVRQDVKLENTAGLKMGLGAFSTYCDLHIFVFSILFSPKRIRPSYMCFSLPNVVNSITFDS
jgi:hypothetical protein